MSRTGVKRNNIQKEVCGKYLSEDPNRNLENLGDQRRPNVQLQILTWYLKPATLTAEHLLFEDLFWVVHLCLPCF